MKLLVLDAYAPQGREALVGAGGTARALVYGLLEHGCEVFVLNRTLERAEALVLELGATSAGRLQSIAQARSTS